MEMAATGTGFCAIIVDDVKMTAAPCACAPAERMMMMTGGGGVTIM